VEAPLVLGLRLLHQAGREALMSRYRLVELDDVTQVGRWISEADALYAYSPLQVDSDLITRGKHLKVIAAAGSGVDHIDLEAAWKSDIVVTHAVGAGAISVAEHAVGHMLCLAKKLVDMDRAVREGRFEQRTENRHHFGELSGRTLAIVGFGAIGRELARIASRGFDMRVIAVTRDGAPVEDENVGQTMSLHEALAQADVVSVHTPLSRTTRGLIGHAEFARMKSTAWLVDTSRGGVVNSDALYSALAEGRLGGAALDVFEPEPPPTQLPLLSLPNVVLSPHCAGLTREALQRLSLAAAHDIDCALCGLPPPGLVAPKSWVGSRAAALSPRSEPINQLGNSQ